MEVELTKNIAGDSEQQLINCPQPNIIIYLLYWFQMSRNIYNIYKVPIGTSVTYHLNIANSDIGVILSQVIRNKILNTDNYSLQKL